MSKPNSGHVKSKSGIKSSGGGGGGGKGSEDGIISGASSGSTAQSTITGGAPSASGVSGAGNEVPPLFNNGSMSFEGIKAHSKELVVKTVDEFVELMEQNGYAVHIRNSKHPSSTAQIIAVDNPSKRRNVAQIQVSPGGGIHGKDPYIKISIKRFGRVKIVNGSPDDYKHGENEKAYVIFTKGEKI